MIHPDLFSALSMILGNDYRDNSCCGMEYGTVPGTIDASLIESMVHPAYLGAIHGDELTPGMKGEVKHMFRIEIMRRTSLAHYCITAYGVWRQLHSCQVQKRKLLENKHEQANIGKTFPFSVWNGTTTPHGSQDRSLCYMRDLMQGQAHNSSHMQFAATKITIRTE